MAFTVSVILPTYNRAATLERAIESVLHQSFNDFELIIVDDRSTDETNLVLSRYAYHNNVRVVTQLRRGCAVARNIGVSIAEGRYIAFQDSDDEWRPEMLANAVSVLDGSGPDLGVFYTDMLRVRADGVSAPWKSPDVRQKVLVDNRTLDYQVTGIGMQSAVIKRECFDAVGGFDEALPRFIDLELFIRLSDRFDFFHCKEMLVMYYAVDGISTNRHALVAARRHLLNKYRSRLARHKPHLAKQYLHLAAALDQNGETLQSLAFVLKAFLTSARWPIRKGVFEFMRRRAHELQARYRNSGRVRPAGARCLDENTQFQDRL